MPERQVTPQEREIVAEAEALRRELMRAKRANTKLRSAIRWALGEGKSNFGDHLTGGEPRFWWRSELRKRAGL